MGMFDTLKCEYPLPDKIVQGDSFQTKSLDCLLDNYTICKDGKLILHRQRHYEASVKKITIDFHGNLRFYTSQGSRETDNYEWFEYVARFTDGNLQWIKRVELKIKEEICHTTN
jgi:hypothetical protein